MILISSILIIFMGAKRLGARLKNKRLLTTALVCQQISPPSNNNSKIIKALK
jgi:hypothetical protein